MHVLDEQGKEIKTMEELLNKFPNAKVEHGVTERVMVKHDDETVTWEEKQTTRITVGKQVQ